MIAEQAEHDIHGLEASYDLWLRDRSDKLSLFSAMLNTRRKSYYGSDMDPDAYGRTADLVVTTGAQYLHPFDRLLFMPAELIGGVEYSYNRLHDVTVGYDHDIMQKVNIYSAYLQNEWRTSRWGFLIGARVDKHSLIDHAIISPRANVRFNPSDRFNFRLPTPPASVPPCIYDEDLHVAIVGGERVVTVLAPGLKQESSQSVSLSADTYLQLGSVMTNFLVEGFFTDLSDVFALRQLPEPDAAGNTVLQRYNGSGARVLGLNLEAKAFFSSRFDLQAGVTIQSSRYKQPEQWSDNPDVAPVRKMFRTPDLYGYFTANLQIARRLRATLSGTLTGPMLVQHLTGSGTPVDVAVTTPTFFDLSAKVTYTFRLLRRVDLDLSAGMGNIFNSYQSDFDLGPGRDSGYIYGPAMPRTISLTLALSL